MRFSVIATHLFIKKAKKLNKKYKSLKQDLEPLINSLETNPRQGTSLGNDCYKIRLAISAKNKGKSSGARLITYLRVYQNKIYLLDIYDKSEKDSVSENEIKQWIKWLREKR